LLKQAYAEIPDLPQCPRCGLSLPKEAGHFHHPAGRRKAAYTFGFILHPHCHEWAHANGKDAEAIGLLWSGRNSKTFTVDDANELVLKQLFPARYAIPIWIRYTP